MVGAIMLSLANVKMVQAANYYQKDDYYTRSSDNTDTWQGKLSKQYSQNGGQVTAEDFTAALKSMPNQERAAIDLTFSAPKSVSIAMVLDESKKADMLAAHNKAVADTLQEIEENEIEARVTKNGVTERVKTENMAAAKFNHFVSRNQDMQLHTHAIILNRTEFDGKLYAISNENLYENHILYGQLYRNRLAANLQNMGYQCRVIDSEKGFFELGGINNETIQHFSSRRAEILERLKEWNTNSAAAADRATLLTRKAKTNKDLSVLEQSWREQLQQVALNKGEKICLGEAGQTAAFDRAVTRLADKQFAFSAKELERAALAEGCISGMDRSEFKKSLQESGLVELGRLEKENYYTTRQNIEIEKEIRKNFTDPHTKIKPIKDSQVKLKQLSEKLGLTLSDEQHQAVLHIANSPKQYIAVQGLAGTGKTYMLKVACQLFEDNGYEVRGTSFTGKAAESLQKEAMIKSGTLHSFLNQLEKEAGNHTEVSGKIKNTWNFTGLKSGIKPQLWIVDEAGMTDNNLLVHLQRAAGLKNAKVVLVGDYQQLQPVGVGNAYAKFVQNGELPTCYMSEIRRQKNTDLLQVVKEAVSGDVVKSLEILRENTKEIQSSQKRFLAIAKEYADLSPAEQDQTIVLTAKNRDRVAINDKIRTQLVKGGKVEPEKGQNVIINCAESVEIHRNFAPNDKIIFLKNDYKLGVKNGQIGKISAIDGQYLTARSNGRSYKINLSEYNHIDYGYCVTTHKAQGMTVNKAIIHIDSNQKALNSRNGYYVNVSRAKNAVSIYTDNQVKIGRQVNSWMKKVTSEDFLIASNGVKSGGSVKAKIPGLPKLPMSMPMIPIPVVGTLLNLPLKVMGMGFKVGMKAVNTAIKVSGKIMDLHSQTQTKVAKNSKGHHL